MDYNNITYYYINYIYNNLQLYIYYYYYKNSKKNEL